MSPSAYLAPAFLDAFRFQSNVEPDPLVKRRRVIGMLGKDLVQGNFLVFWA
jgi:hypothetical protein